jgi:hypothetical protein
MANTGKLLVIVGIIVVIIGLIIWFGGNKFGWFGNLPGDIRLEKKNYSFYAPLTTMLLISGALSFLIWVVGKFLK